MVVYTVRVGVLQSQRDERAGAGVGHIRHHSRVRSEPRVGAAHRLEAAVPQLCQLRPTSLHRHGQSLTGTYTGAYAGTTTRAYTGTTGITGAYIGITGAYTGTTTGAYTLHRDNRGVHRDNNRGVHRHNRGVHRDNRGVHRCTGITGAYTGITGAYTGVHDNRDVHRDNRGLHRDNRGVHRCTGITAAYIGTTGAYTGKLLTGRVRSTATCLFSLRPGSENFGTFGRLA